MDNVSLIERLAQADDSEVGEAFDAFMHTAARTALAAVFFQEVEALCGKAYQPSETSDFQRAGSAPGRYFFGSEEFAISRPRVRHHEGCKSKEIRLQSHGAAGNRDRAFHKCDAVLPICGGTPSPESADSEDAVPPYGISNVNCSSLHDAMLRAFMAGVPSREHQRMFKGASGTSHGEVSRLWEREGLRCIEQLRERDRGKEDYVVLMLDGIGLGNNLSAIVALGITVDGGKHILDFQIGAPENLEACTDLFARIEGRGFKPRRRLLANALFHQLHYILSIQLHCKTF